ncbi:hypothetical protein LCGC14_2092730, partial [marine sediment metagenome]
MAGRPKRVFTPEEVQGIEQYARIGSYNRTISTGMSIPLNTLERHFGAKIRHWRAAGKLDMRVNLHKQAENSAQTAIFIAKNELGMVDKQEIRTEAVDTKSRTEQQLEADKAAARAYNEAMSKTNIIPIKETKNG